MKIQTLIAAICFASCTAHAATFSVINTNDNGAGSLRQAILDANASNGVDTINFNIPGAGQQTITVSSNLPDFVETVTLDGGNGGVASNRVELTGAGAVCCGLGFNTTSADNSVVRNLVINGFPSREIIVINTSGHTISGCLLGLNAAGTAMVPDSGVGILLVNSSGNLIGGTNAATRNVISSINANPLQVNGSATIQGNYIGLNAAGTAVLGIPGTGISVNNGFANVISNVIVGFTGVYIGGNPALGRSSAVVQGNFIGTDAIGMTALNFNGGEGVNCDHSINCLVADNVISGNGTGVRSASSGISGASSLNNTFSNNLIGVAADGFTPLGNRLNGFDLGCPSNTVVNNTIAFNDGIGIFNVFDQPGNQFLGNSIFSNGALGIDISPAGVTTNDLCDADLAGFGAQNFPTITGVLRASGTVTISGFLGGMPNTDFRLEFFDNVVCEENGFGEGEFFIGFNNVITGANCTNNFTVAFDDLNGQFITATATPTNSLGSTSEFSARFPADPCAPVADCSLAPSLATNTVGTLHTVTVTVTSNGFAAGNINVTFDLTGANGTVQTNITTTGNGQASFSYTGLNTGTDSILATGSVGTAKFACEATKVWISAPPSNSPPVAVCLFVTIEADANCQTNLVALDFDGGSIDNDGSITSRSISPTGPFGKGIHQVILTVTDNDGASDSCTSTVTVLDFTLPVLTCNDVTVTAPAGQTNAVVLFDATAIDSCGAVTLSCTVTSGSTFNLGTTPVTCTAVDEAANTNTCTFNVTVQAVGPCTITCPADIVTNTALGVCGATVTFNVGSSGSCPAIVAAPASGSFFNKGTNTVTVTTNGVTACTFNITVIDNEPPSLSCPGTIITNVPAGVTNAIVNFNLTSADDNCSGGSLIIDPPSGSAFPLGTNTVTVSMSDAAGNTNGCSFDVIVLETPPEAHDLALIKMQAPKNINLKGAEPSLTKFVKVTLQNRSPHDEVITNFTGLVTLVAQSLGTNCPNATVVLHPGPPNNPKTLKPKQKMTVTFDVTWNCANDPLKGEGHEDFRYLAMVHHEAIDGNPDTHPEDDGCPRAALPGGTDPNPDPSKPLKDTGCAGGVDVKTDVFLKQ